MEASLPEPHCFHDCLSSVEPKQQRRTSFESLPRTSYNERANLYGVKLANLLLKAINGTQSCNLEVGIVNS